MSREISRLCLLIVIFLLVFFQKTGANAACKNWIHEMMKAHCRDVYKRSVSYTDDVLKIDTASSENKESDFHAGGILEHLISGGHHNDPGSTLHRSPRSTLPAARVRLRYKRQGFLLSGDGADLGFDDDTSDDDDDMESFFEELYERSARASHTKAIDKRDFVVYAAQCCENKDLCDDVKDNLKNYCP